MKRKVYDGYLTIYMALGLLVLMSLIIVLLDGIRKNTVRTETEIVADIAMNSALAEYHRELLEQYELLFIDSSYGSEFASEANTAERIRHYMNENFKNNGLIEMEAEGVGILEYSAASDEEGEVLYNAIAAYMKSKNGMELIDDFSGQMETISSYKMDTRDITAERKANQESIDRQPTPQKKVIKQEINPDTGLEEEREDYEDVPIDDPAETVNRNRSLGILYLVAQDPQKLSDSAVILDQYLSGRDGKMQGTGPCREQRLKQGTLFDAPSLKKILLQKYLFQKCSYYHNELDKAVLKYQIEYILSGKGRDTDNLKGVVEKLLLLRETANVTFLAGNAAKKAEITAMAAALAAVTVAPQLQPLMEASIMFAWGFAESVQDVSVLLAGGKIPIMKTAATWQTDLEGIFNPLEPQEHKSVDGLDYQEYLQVLLYMQPDEEKLLRLMDIMEMDIRVTPNNENFRMDGCINSFLARASILSNADYNCNITRRYLYE